MNHSKHLDKGLLKSMLEKAGTQGKMDKTADNLKRLFSLIDLTSLNTQDTRGDIAGICRKVNEFPDRFPGVPNVAAVCVYPSLVPVVRKNLTAEGVGIASVAAGFPSSQTYPEVKELESRMAVQAGATEIDIVISLGRYMERDTAYVSDEIRRIKEIVSPSKLKVILETGLLQEPRDLYESSMASLRAGADFIKTSTGKVQPAATPEAVLVMCLAIRDHQGETGIRSGIKPAGGIGTADQALEYAMIVRYVLGQEWLDPALFRIGASRLANQILTEISRIETGGESTVDYF